jgi:hypothetical protein
MIVRSRRNRLPQTIMRRSMIRLFQRTMLKRRRPAAIRPLGLTGKEPVIPERMDAIQKSKTMAGSLDAELSISVPPSCHGFVFGAHVLS